MARRKRKQKQRKSLFEIFRRKPVEFRPDAQGSSLRKLLHFTHQQWTEFLRWLLYTGMCLLMLLLQDVLMSRLAVMGATTDLVPAIILLIAVMENSEVGSLFALISGILYFFSGSAPLAYCVIFLTVFGMFFSLLRQQYLHRSIGTVVVCAGGAVIVYELALWSIGLFLGLTRFDRLGKFFLTGMYSTAAMVPLYWVLNKIGTMGGRQWKE